jgi:DNA/RNA-binding domain of Phe-tRNA-synthetase-like protein
MTTASHPFVPQVDAAIWRLRPDFVALSVVVRNGRNAPSGNGDEWRAPASPPWAQDHLESWREAYRAFGAKPQRTPCSAEALRRRLDRDGSLQPINAVVDAYNRISAEFALPVGGENLIAYAGVPRLVRATGGERFETTRDGQPHVETVDGGEVVWRDDLGVTCRRWNWRQSARTRLEIDTADMWFVLERLDPMPIAALEEAGEKLVQALRGLAPDAVISRMLLAISREGRSSSALNSSSR